MKNVFYCEICKRTYILSEDILHRCDFCHIKLTIQPNDIKIRCKDCGVSQDLNLYFDKSDNNALICQNLKCNGLITVIEPIDPSQCIGDPLPAPIEGNVDHISNDEIEKLNEIESKIIQYIPKEVSLPFLGQIQFRKETLGIKPGDFLEIGQNYYQILCQIGIGGMGAVHQAIDHQSQKIIAIKEFFYSCYQNHETGENLCEFYWDREAKLTQLQSDAPHPCLKFVGSLKMDYIEKHEYYIALDYIDGITLEKWFLERYQTLSNLTIREIRMIIKDILIPLSRHLHYVHEKGIVHRDITPQNIMICNKKDSLTPILIDWGVAKMIGIENIYNPSPNYFEDNEPECTGIINRGTPPEVISGYNPVAATDVYMFGHLIYYILTGGHYSNTACTKSEYILLPQDLNPDIPSVLNKLVEYMTQYEPVDRLKSMKAVEDSLQHIYNITALLEPEKDLPVKYFLYCENNHALFPISEKKIMRFGKDEIIGGGKDEDENNILFETLIPTEQNHCQFELYLDNDILYIQDLYSHTGTFLENLTLQNLEVFSIIDISGKSNCFIPLIAENIDRTAIMIPCHIESKEYGIRFFIQKEYSC